MKCQQCDKPATFHITELTGGKPQELHLCEDHARQYLTASASEPAAVRQHGGRGPADGPANGRSARPPRSWRGSISRPARCAGSRFYEFRSQGRLGCPHDYVCFQAQLEPLILNIHGESEHVGKRPQPARPAGARNAPS